jgi:signal transduction histidine kinase
MIPRRGALGLRGRIVGAVLVTTVATLVVAALALLGPLEHKLRAAESKAFQGQIPRGASTRAFATIANLSDVLIVAAPVQHPTKGMPQEERQQIAKQNGSQQLRVAAYRRLEKQEAALVTRVGASEVAVLGGSRTGRLRVFARAPADVDLAGADRFEDAARALATNKPVYTTGSLDGTEYARAALPFTFRDSATGQKLLWVLAVRKPFVEVNDAARAVRTAFLDAALAGLGLTLILAIPLSSRIVRRLRRLRKAALDLAEQGPPVEVPGQRTRDEVGDLARAFALMQVQLEQQEEARRAFVATASHELRTPLTSLEGMLELLQEDLNAPDPELDDARDMLARARVQSHRLARLAADLLDLSRLDAQVQLRSEPVELGELSRAVLAEFELGTAEKEVACELHESGEPVWALGDPGSVARILRILIDNAMRVSPPGSEIHVELSGGTRVALRVCDQGPGVAPEDRDQIFQRFQRGRSTSGQAGFGLGLAIGRELAQRMEGELVLEDTSRAGATFTLHLPRASAPTDHDTLALL